MKTQYERVFVAHVGVKLEKAKGLGISASWTTQNHLDALADCIAQHPTEQVRDILGECYNISAYQQLLAKRFEKVPGGHFQREKSKPVGAQVDDLLAALVADAAKPAQG